MDPFWSAVTAIVTALSVLAAVALTSHFDGKRAADAADREDHRRLAERAVAAAHEIIRLTGRAVDVYLPEASRDRHEARVEGDAIARDILRVAIDIEDKAVRETTEKIAWAIQDAQFFHRVYPMASWTAVRLANEAARDVLGTFVRRDDPKDSAALASLMKAVDALEEDRKLQREAEEQRIKEEEAATPSDPAD